MTQADSVHSTPPTNTSVTRRSALGTIASFRSPQQHRLRPRRPLTPN